MQEKTIKDIWEFKDHSKRNTICYTPGSIRHPAKMELNMCRKIIKLYSKKGDLILDPMVGIGSTIIEGMILGRNVIGVEYEQKFVDMTKENIEKTTKSLSFMKTLGKGQVIKGDSRQLSDLLNNKADSILFSPPFADTIGTIRGKGTPTYQQTGFANTIPYSEKDSDNIGNFKGKNYLTEMLLIYQQCFKVLKQNSYMIVHLKNFVRAGVQIRLDLDSIKLIEKAGFKYIRRHYRKIKNPSFWITNAIQKWEKKHKEPHPYPLVEDILVLFKKED